MAIDDPQNPGSPLQMMDPVITPEVVKTKKRWSLLIQLWAMKVGVVSDTHGLLRPEVIPALAGVERILHLGDVGDPQF